MAEKPGVLFLASVCVDSIRAVGGNVRWVRERRLVAYGISWSNELVLTTYPYSVKKPKTQNVNTSIECKM